MVNLKNERRNHNDRTCHTSNNQPSMALTKEPNAPIVGPTPTTHKTQPTQQLKITKGQWPSPKTNPLKDALNAIANTMRDLAYDPRPIEIINTMVTTSTQV